MVCVLFAEKKHAVFEKNHLKTASFFKGSWNPATLYSIVIRAYTQGIYSKICFILYTKHDIGAAYLNFMMQEATHEIWVSTLSPSFLMTTLYKKQTLSQARCLNKSNFVLTETDFLCANLSNHIKCFFVKGYH